MSRRFGLVAHPTRDIETPLGDIRAWAGEQGVELVQVRVEGRERDVAPFGDAADCELILALGGDGTTLAAVRAAAAAERPVLGIACGSLGALTTVLATEVRPALERFQAGEWSPLRPPALAVRTAEGQELLAFNDIALVRDGGGQLIVRAEVNGDLFARFAGDGCIVSTPLGSSAYTLAARGPLLTADANAFLLTLLPTHGGFVPPLVVGPDARIGLQLEAGHGGGRLELDGQVTDAWSPQLTITLRQEVATVVRFADTESLFAGLRRRRIIIDSPRILAEDERR
jgi:NAD+ kinase